MASKKQLEIESRAWSIWVGTRVLNGYDGKPQKPVPMDEAMKIAEKQYKREHKEVAE